MQPCGVYHTSYQKDMAITHTRLQKVSLGCFLMLLLLAPNLLNRYWLNFLNSATLVLIAATGVNLLTGYCGQITLGQSAFVAVGAYSTAILAGKFGGHFWIIIPCAGFISGLIGLIFALPSVRIKGFYLAMVTLGAHFIILWVISHTTPLTGGTFGITLPQAKIGGFIFDTDKSCYYLIMSVTVLIVYFANNLARTKTGRAFVAIRDNDLSAEVMGIDLFRYKLLAFFLCSFIAGVAGSLQAFLLVSISLEQFSLMDSIWYLGMIIIGGMGRVLGPILGTVLVLLLNERITALSPFIASTFPAIGATVFASLGKVVFGLTVILFLIFEPRGLSNRWEIIKNYFRLYPFPYF